MTFFSRRCAHVVAAMVVITAGSLSGQEQPRRGEAAVQFPISCSGAAQAEFNRGVTLVHHMTYPRAREAFENVKRLDGQCAMAHWGIAMTLFQPLWPTRPGISERRAGWDASHHASRLATTERERLLGEAIAAFFRDPESPDYWRRIQRWEQAMERVHAAFPDDAEITAFYALAHLAAAPPNEDSVAAHSARAAELLLAIYRRHPGHPGAMHYLVHANDAPGREHSSLDVTRLYEASAPRNPHALHMPTHIYTRLGEWDAVVRGNLLAAEAALEHPSGDRGQYVWDEFPHAIEYVVYAYLQQGADSQALAALERLHATPHLDPTFKTAFHLASTRARYALERHAWDEAAALNPRDASSITWDLFPWPEAVTWFAKALGAARMGRIADARAAAAELSALEENARRANENLFASNIRILDLEARAWIAQAEGDATGSVRLAREAADLESLTPKHAVTPAPTLPAHEVWADILFAQRRFAEALEQYRISLRHYPRRFNSVMGAARAAAAAGDVVAAREYYLELLSIASKTGRRATVDEARRFVASK